MFDDDYTLKTDPDSDYWEPCPCRACATEGRLSCADLGHEPRCRYCAH